MTFLVLGPWAPTPKHTDRETRIGTDGFKKRGKTGRVRLTRVGTINPEHTRVSDWTGLIEPRPEKV